MQLHPAPHVQDHPQETAQTCRQLSASKSQEVWRQHGRAHERGMMGRGTVYSMESLYFGNDFVKKRSSFCKSPHAFLCRTIHKRRRHIRPYHSHDADIGERCTQSPSETVRRGKKHPLQVREGDEPSSWRQALFHRVKQLTLHLLTEIRPGKTRKNGIESPAIRACKVMGEMDGRITPHIDIWTSLSGLSHKSRIDFEHNEGRIGWLSRLDPLCADSRPRPKFGNGSGMLHIRRIDHQCCECCRTWKDGTRLERMAQELTEEADGIRYVHACTLCISDLNVRGSKLTNTMNYDIIIDILLPHV